MDEPFIPLEKSSYKIIYEKCVDENVYSISVILILVIIGLSLFWGNVVVALLVGVADYYWIAPDGIRAVYNKSHGSESASNTACVICMLFSLLGWFICAIYEFL
jgi:hypothetical protein